MKRQRTKQTARSLGSSIPSDGLDLSDEPHPSDHITSSGTLSQAKLAGRREISEPRGKARAAGADRSDGRKMLRVGPGSLPLTDAFFWSQSSTWHEMASSGPTTHQATTSALPASGIIKRIK
ncbi:hypothetical protein C4D60_Mb02t13400 [Musa balbisiana]|uniref:Uncharacterized protein n=1 Tax=Musa balbisiana TaxID=52838 RepID=A0A4S8IAE3_MUSBA|nr:hypothetical protein C4D60_Mb02t13400 [Musa balbisiana]